MGDVAASTEVSTADTASLIVGEGLRALALVWLAMAVSELGAAPLFASPWVWIVVGAAAATFGVGLAYWWVVPAPPSDTVDERERLLGELRSAVALLDVARRLTLFGLVAAAALAGVGATVGSGSLTSRVVVAGGCIFAAAVAVWWARSRFVWLRGELEVVPRRASILYNGRFILRQLIRFEHARRTIQSEAPELRSAIRTHLAKATELTNEADRHAQLRLAARDHSRLSQLMHVDDFASFPAQDLEALATNLRAEVEVDPRWLVPRAWARIIVSLVFNQAFRRTRIASTELDGRLAQWRSRPAAHWDYWAGRAPFQELNEIIDPTPAQSPHTTVDALQAKLEDWASTVPRDGRSF
jgi:hypothetical protein